MAAAVPVLGKMLVSAAVGKVVGKVTGNDKLGMLAGMATGIGMSGGFTPEGTVGESTATMTTAEGATASATSPSITGIGKTPVAAFASDPGGSVGGMLTKAGEWTKENPYGAIIGAQTVGGAVNVYEQRKIAEEEARQAKLDRELQRELQTNQFQENQSEYDRTHQDWSVNPTKTSPFTPRASGILSEGNAPAPTDPSSDYYNKYLNMYKGGVR